MMQRVYEEGRTKSTEITNTIASLPTFFYHSDIMKKEFIIAVVLAALWCLGFVLAPLTVGTTVSELLYRWYGHVCHQISAHSIQADGHPLAVCIRCSAIYLAFLASLTAAGLSESVRRFSERKTGLLFLACTPVIIDGLLSLLQIVDATAASRILTGSLFGAAIALLLQSALSETIGSFISSDKRNYDVKTG